MSVLFNTSENKTSIDSGKISGKNNFKFIKSCWKVSFEVFVNAGLSYTRFQTTGP
jgi:hypothetical protein